jgi:putative addiction module component (TIGR02574 family)
MRIDFVMNLDQTLSELTSLPVTDRLRVVESLWDSIDAEAPVSVSPEQRAEIERRIQSHETNPGELLTWGDVLDQLRDRK